MLGRITLSTVDNQGPNTLARELKAAFLGAKSVDVHVAFITQAGLEKLITQLMSIAERGAVRITGLITGILRSRREPVSRFL
jgi:HKD family nuclease